jgi:hypothetical protein
MAWLREATTIEVLVVDFENMPVSADETCCGYKVLRRMPIVEEDHRIELIRALERGFEESRVPDFPIYSGCDLHHGLRARDARGDVLEIGFAFQFHWATVMRPDGQKCRYNTSESPQAAFDKLLQDDAISSEDDTSWE